MTELSYFIAALFAAAAVALFILAIRLSYRIERMKQPDLPKPRMVYTNIFASAFGAPPHEEGAKAAATLRGMLLACVLLVLTGAASSYMLRGPHDPLADVHALDFMPEGSYILEPGITLHYTRANQDGSRPARVLVHVVSDRELTVAALDETCEDATLSTVRFDPRTGEPVRIVTGKLGRDGEQAPETWISFNGRQRTIQLRRGGERSQPLSTQDAPAAPWRLYDLDLAEFALYGPRLGEAFSFGVARIAEGDPAFVETRGGGGGEPLMSTVRMGRPVTMYAVTGEAFGGASGDEGGLVMLDHDYGFIIEARLGRPTRPGYADLHLKLDFVDYGADFFRADLFEHWGACSDAPADSDTDPQ